MIKLRCICGSKIITDNDALSGIAYFAIIRDGHEIACGQCGTRYGPGSEIELSYGYDEEELEELGARSIRIQKEVL
jgi:hypothetical protein